MTVTFTTQDSSSSTLDDHHLNISMSNVVNNFDTMKQPNNYRSTPSSTGRRFIISCFFFIVFLCTLASVNEIRFDSFLRFKKCAFSPLPLDDSPTQNLLLTNSSSSSSNVTNSTSSSIEELRILIGILTLPDHYYQRHFLRLIYGTQSPENARVDVKFVFCNLTKEEQKVFVALEIMRYDDIIILNCHENMNDGKTYAYFSSLPEMLASSSLYPPYHYVLKTDDDSYFRLNNLVNSLRPLSREDLYYGFVIPCLSMDAYRNYMSGMGYLVSWDIVEWIKESEIPRSHLHGPEDKVFGEWIRWGKRGKNRYNAKWSMYNFPEPPSGCGHELWPETVAVHLLKTPQKWMKTLKYFNVTKNLKPSKLYHIDP
ncbi:OLC1v1035184C1 [Oldenlandia corymbosa var. corymbosa]|uniref:Hexosyltransferase n=1 Tax=Oldenlandia corymbosa var. corymbosa TaxID=529605 RepID=A0AAV1CSC4_OLDCO|nr:OLC1v1035184C1 [Oldenlandia corymbosa var. corymbosa]